MYCHGRSSPSCPPTLTYVVPCSEFPIVPPYPHMCGATVRVLHRLLLPSYVKCHGRSSPSSPPTLTTHRRGLMWSALSNPISSPPLPLPCPPPLHLSFSPSLPLSLSPSLLLSLYPYIPPSISPSPPHFLPLSLPLKADHTSWRSYYWYRNLRGDLNHPGGNPRANLESISRRCYLREVAFEWNSTKETIYLPLWVVSRLDNNYLTKMCSGS